MTYTEVGSGGILATGCSGVVYYNNVRTLYGAGDILYDVHKARKGVLQKVVIKGQRVIQSKKTHGLIVALYVDTYNGLWNESDLVQHEQAVLLATAYYEKYLVDLAKLDSCAF